MKENLCKDYHILMQAVLDGEAPPSDQAKWREHAESCESCRKLFGELAGLKKAMAGTLADPPYGLDEAILKKIHTEDKQRKLHTINRRQHTFRSVMGVAAALVILVAGSWTLTRYGGKAVETADNAFMMETAEEIVLEAEAAPEESASDVGSVESDMEYSSQSSNSAAGTTVLEDGQSLTDRTEILDVLRTAASGLNLPGSYKTCVYLDCDNLPQGREQYLVSPKSNVARTVLPYDLTFYSTDDYLSFINGAGLELNFSLELTEEEMQACGLVTGGNLTLVVVATPVV